MINEYEINNNTYTKGIVLFVKKTHFYCEIQLNILLKIIFNQKLKTYIMKKLLIIGKALNKNEQQEITGGRKIIQPFVCTAGYFIQAEETCAIGYHLHPQGHCICCRD